MRFARTRTLTTLLMSLALSGCVGYETHVEASQTAVPGSLWMSHLVPGETPSSWLIEQFGYPVKVTHTDEQTAVWQYENVYYRSKRVRALPLFAMELNDTERTVHNFEITDDRVTRYWRQGEG